ncbi:N-acetylornithine carbamoyltransferase [Fulvivirga sp. RKSG066]|uniref:N-acetylornithine carbamoyltransferase n=1 Tax=Fulvivirga aurantia TaxID=2529383 RepID=UPI0012BD329C|nr:N-acetylornithine carbamoyltransferase [Fulvivirga aurantia]MTI22507.1 N-acetylornithine carbamoyltransferase [Fulvivirga aurantia]
MNFTSINDISSPVQLLELAKQIKLKPFDYREFGQNKTLGLLFFNPSLRTRLSTQKAANNLGMDVIVMNVGQDGWQLEMDEGVVMNGSKQEHIKDAVAVLSQYCDIIGVRTFASLNDRKADYEELVLKQFLKYTHVPIISLESATLHPLQSLADWLTIEEHKVAHKPKVVLTWAPHVKPLPQAVANSFVEWMKLAEVDLTITNPIGFDLAPQFSKDVKVEHNQDMALAQADFVYAKNWSSYQDYGTIGGEMTDWQITPEKMSLTNNAKFMHCLPVRRNVVVSDEVIDGQNSLVYEQANNRTYAAQAVLLNLLQL